MTHLVPVYHVPAFPSLCNYNGRSNPLIREHWVPLFDKYELEMVFEYHDHQYKRTLPIRNGQVDHQEGITYIGDGPLGGGKQVYDI